MRTDWAAIKAEYVATGTGMRTLAEKYHVSLSALGTHAAREDWVEAREAEQKRIAESAVARSRRKRANREQAALERLMDQAEKLISAIDLALEDPYQLYRHIIGIGKGEQEEQTLGKMDTKAARDFVGMIAELQEVVATSGGILDKKTAEDLKLKRARLNLDKQKAGLNGTPEGESGIALLPQVETDAESEVVVGDDGEE